MTDSLLLQACAVALVELKGMTPRMLTAALVDATPDIVWQRVCEGGDLGDAFAAISNDDTQKLRAEWRSVAPSVDPSVVLDRYRAAGVGIWTRHDDFPKRLLIDDWAPSVLFYRGNTELVDRDVQEHTAGMVGMRQCSEEGRYNARRMGAELSAAGVSIVSGLARGIDTASHEGALSVEGARPIGVVGSGLDRVYPYDNRDLWNVVARDGLLISEAPLGAPPARWRFPARNRIIAALSDVVVVVESGRKGGSLITATQAKERGIEVMAVPGSIRSKTSVGTNALLKDGCAVAMGTQDVLDLLSLTVPLMQQQVLLPAEADMTVLNAIDRTPTSTEEVMLRTRSSLGTVATSLLRLQEGGWIAGIEGWWQRVDDEAAGL